MSNTPKKIIVIDDEPQGIHLILKSLGYEVEMYTSPSEGLHHIIDRSNGHYDLVLVDLVMPGMTGWEILNEIRNNEKSKTLPVIILSALSNNEAQASGLNQGADDYIYKPYELSTLIARIESLFRRVEWDRKPLTNLNITSSKPVSEISNDENEPLTHRQIEILKLMSQGYSNKQMADNLFLSETTIKAHLRSIFKKLKVANRTQAVLIGLKTGLIA